MTNEKNNWEEVNPATQDTWDFRNQPTIQGIYTGKREKVGPNDSNLYALEVKGEKIGVWGSTVLDTHFDQIPIGSEVRIEYLGKAKAEKSGREYHDFKVLKRPAPFKEVGEGETGTTVQVPEEEIPVVENE